MTPVDRLATREVARLAMLRSVLTRLTVATAFVAVVSHAVAAQEPFPCGDSTLRVTLRVHLEEMMVPRDGETTLARSETHLPLVHPDSIRYIDDRRICERAARIYYRYRLGPHPLGGVAVARVGTMWVVFGKQRMGEWTGLDVYNRDFGLVASLAI